jgi:hypothetical protein
MQQRFPRSRADDDIEMLAHGGYWSGSATNPYNRILPQFQLRRRFRELQ